MSKIKIVDLEVFYSVGITEAERARPQRLLLTVEMDYDFTAAARSDRIEETINYASVAGDLLEYGHGRSWRLLEKLAAELADLVLNRYQVGGVSIEVKKFVIPQASYVSVSLSKAKTS